MLKWRVRGPIVEWREIESALARYVRGVDPDGLLVALELAQSFGLVEAKLKPDEEIMSRTVRLVGIAADGLRREQVEVVAQTLNAAEWRLRTDIPLFAFRQALKQELSASLTPSRPLTSKWQAIWGVAKHPLSLHRAFRRVFSVEIVLTAPDAIRSRIRLDDREWRISDTASLWVRSQVSFHCDSRLVAVAAQPAEILSVFDRYTYAQTKLAAGAIPMTQDWIAVAAQQQPELLLRMCVDAYRPDWAARAARMMAPHPVRSAFALLAEEREMGSNAANKLLTMDFGVPDATGTLQPLVSAGQFRPIHTTLLSDVEVWHGVLTTKSGSLVIMDRGAEPRSDFVAGLWHLVWSGPTLGGQALVISPDVEPGSVDSAVCGFGRADTNWFHFIIETLPRLLLAHESAPSEAPLLLRCDLPRSARQLAEALTGRTVLELGPNSRIRVRQLFGAVGPASTLDTAWQQGLAPEFSSATVNLVRAAIREIYGSPADDPHELIMMLRDRPYRRLLNIKRVRRIAQRYGFREHRMERLSAEEQIRLLSTAAIVLIQGGAAMANLVFARPGTRVIVLVGRTNHQVEFWRQLAEACQVEAIFVPDQVIRGRRGRTHLHEDFRVSVRAMRRQLHDLGLRPRRPGWTHAASWPQTGGH